MKLSYRNPKNAVAIAAYWGKSLDKPDWYEVKAQTGGETEIFIYDVIGWPFNDIGGLVREMAGMKDKPILARINSPGGDVFDGMSLFNAFTNHPGGVTVRIEGLAASIASIVAMGGRKVEAYQNTMFMVHNAWAWMGGDQNAMREVADIIEKISDQMQDVYTGKTKSGKKEMKQMMDDETWMTAKEAEAKGFIDTILANGKGAKAQFDLSVFANCPDNLLPDDDIDPETDKRKIEKALRDVGFSLNNAKAFIARGLKAGGEADEVKVAAQKTLTIFRGK